jgi:tetratricopeptide (TPR) repeat protein
MLHVKQIETLVDEGAHSDAHQALDQLLALGPQNTAALKLRAQLLDYAGRFDEESRIWDKIAGIDPEDEDAVNYYFNRQIEDREAFYFTDDLPGGGRRYLAQPKALIQSAVYLLFSCLTFVYLAAGAVKQWPVLGTPPVFLPLFAGLVILPCAYVLFLYMRSLKAVSVSSAGITISSRLRRYHFAWPEIKEVALASSFTNQKAELHLVVVPTVETAPRVLVDLGLHSTPIRARSYLVRDIQRHFQDPVYRQLSEILRSKADPAVRF